MRVLYPIVLLDALGVVEAIKVTNEIAGDSSDALKPHPLAYKPGFGINTQMIEICHDIFSFRQTASQESVKLMPSWDAASRQENCMTYRAPGARRNVYAQCSSADLAKWHFALLMSCA